MSKHVTASLAECFQTQSRLAAARRLGGRHMQATAVSVWQCRRREVRRLTGTADGPGQPIPEPGAL